LHTPVLKVALVRLHPYTRKRILYVQPTHQQNVMMRNFRKCSNCYPPFFPCTFHTSETLLYK